MPVLAAAAQQPQAAAVAELRRPVASSAVSSPESSCKYYMILKHIETTSEQQRKIMALCSEYFSKIFEWHSHRRQSSEFPEPTVVVVLHIGVRSEQARGADSRLDIGLYAILSLVLWLQ